MFVVHTSNCHGQNCTRRAIFRLGIDTLIANILVFVFFSSSSYGSLMRGRITLCIPSECKLTTLATLSHVVKNWKINDDK